jgi:hypothetical protein
VRVGKGRAQFLSAYAYPRETECEGHVARQKSPKVGLRPTLPVPRSFRQSGPWAIFQTFARGSDSLHRADRDENCVDLLGSLAAVRGYGRGGEGFFDQNRWSYWSGDGELHFAKYR